MGIYTKEEQFKLIRKSSDNLKIIDNQYEEVCLEAVKRKGYTLKYVKEQTPQICLEAVKQDGIALDYVKDQTEEICLEAVKQDADALYYVKQQTPEICLEAVKKDGWSLRYVKEKTEKICVEAVKQDVKAFHYAEVKTHEMCMDAIKDNIFNIKFLNSSMYEWYEDILKYSILRLENNEDIDFSKCCFYISDTGFDIKLKNIENEYIKNLKIIYLPYNKISENGFFDYIVGLNSKFAFIIDDSLDKEVWSKLILSNNYIIGLSNNEKAKYYSKWLNYVMKKHEFEILDDDIPL